MMEHIFIKGDPATNQTLLLLHGTGGNEKDLLPLAEMIDPKASVLGVRGNVVENGMSRFFRRLSEGVFDEEDLIIRTHELNEFITEMSVQYGFDRKQVVAVGYSNGANIAASLLYHDVESLHAAILFHAMVPLRNIKIPDLSDKHVFIGAGMKDPLIPQIETKELIKNLQDSNAIVTEHWGEGGHELTRKEVELATKWYTDLFIR